ncbi:SsgA family sporulation/cell division regulator [Streptomyces sp. NPDC048255]|uniref:SsgA family sporulation/cell division regulator n=1 Tax=Streptomyces sp. NPDC048255 TaxID=3154713 RepID=UPI0034068E16
MNRSIDANFFMRLESADRRFPILTRLHYDAQRPFEMTVTFRGITGETPVVWTFARDLMFDGRLHLVGLGDVRIWPIRVEQSTRVYLSLSSDSGECLVSACITHINMWCRRMSALVPPGTEHRHFDLDREVGLLLR